MTTFKSFITQPSGQIPDKAMREYGIERARPQDIAAALKIVGAVLGVSVMKLRSRLLGSSRVTALGQRASSGDIDIALSTAEHQPTHVHQLMMQHTAGRGRWNAGTKIASYAVDVGDRTVQVDLMFVSDLAWAKFIYYSAQGELSQWSGAVRNVLLMTVLSTRCVDGEDFSIKDDHGREIARARRSIHMNEGMVRLFKLLHTGPRGGQQLKTVSPAQLQSWIDQHYPDVKFSHDAAVVSDPRRVTEFIFGAGVTPDQVRTAEQIIELIAKSPSPAHLAQLARENLERAGLPMPHNLDLLL